MLYRAESPGVILISQPAHAWVSGQIARAWGNEVFESVPEEVRLAAEQHDIGFLDWERAPTRNPETGLPYTFLELPTQEHLDLWRLGVKQMLRFGRLSALLVSMHFTNITRQNWVCDKQEKSALKQDYLQSQEAFQTSLMTSLANDVHYGPICLEARVRSWQQLVSVWDWMSLLLCLGFEDERPVEKVPARNGPMPMRLLPPRKNSSEIRVQPWPFGRERVELVCEGRRLLRTYTDEEEMRSAIEAAAPVTLTFALVR